MKTEKGKRYVVIANLDWISKGSILEETIHNKVMLVSGWKSGCKYFEKPSMKYLKQIEDKPMSTTSKFPDYDFKVSTEGFNSDQLKAAYEWLKECAISRGRTLGSLKDNIQRKYYFLSTSSDDAQWHSPRHVPWDSVENDHHPDLPEIKLNIETKSVVIGFTIKDNKEEKLKDIIIRLEQSLEEAKSELNTLKTIKEKV